MQVIVNCSGQYLYMDTSTDSLSALEQEVMQVVSIIRPALQADNGDMRVDHVDTLSGVITVTLLGACVGCPVSSKTLKDGIERTLVARVDGVTKVVLSDAL